MNVTGGSMVFQPVYMNKGGSFRVKGPDDREPENASIMMMMTPGMAEHLG